MPLYEYECSACGHRFEVIQKFSDPPVEICASCKSGPIHKLLSAPAIQFKGTGWYVTDYAGKKSDGSPRKSDGTDKTDSAPPKTSTETSSAPSSSDAASGSSSGSKSGSSESGSGSGSDSGSGATSSPTPSGKKD